MFIKKIKIENFRNIENSTIEPSKKINFICGKNAQGKTNLLELIYFSSVYKSFRTNKNINLINENNTYFNLNLEITNNEVNNKLKIFFDNKKNKKIYINDKKPDFRLYNILNSIIYFPDEIIYLKNYPLYRRNLIDRSIFYVNNDYIKIVKKYLKCLKQRNIFLKYKNDEIDIWRDQLIEYSFSIIEKRIQYIDKVNIFLNNLFLKSKEKEKYFISYSNYKSGEIKDILLNKYKKNSEREKKYGYTLFGPHTDDFSFLLNNNNINKYSSEGQKRSFLLSYKQAELEIYRKIYGYYPVLLFDDMGTELDSSRKENIFNQILENSGQVFITSTDFPFINDINTKRIEVNNGSFSETTQK